MVKKHGRIGSYLKKRKIAKKEYKKYYEEAKTSMARATRKRESQQRKQRASTAAQSKYGLTSQERKAKRKKQLEHIAKTAQKMGEGFSDTDTFFNMDYEPPTPKKLKKTVSKKRPKTKYTVVKGKAVPIVKPKSKKKKTSKTSSGITNYSDFIDSFSKF